MCVTNDRLKKYTTRLTKKKKKKKLRFQVKKIIVRNIYEVKKKRKRSKKIKTKQNKNKKQKQTTTKRNINVTQKIIFTNLPIYM